MSDTPDEQLESQLRELTTWPDATPNLWRRALAAAGSRQKKGRSAVSRVVSYRPSFRLAVGVAAAAIFIAVGIWMNQSGALPGTTLRGVGAGSAIYSYDNFEWYPQHDIAGLDTTVEQPTAGERFDFRGHPYASYGYQLPYARRGKPSETLDVRMPINTDKSPYFVDAGGDGAAPDSQGIRLGCIIASSEDAQPQAERYVIRKATVELVTDDVRAAFLKAALLISEAKGEYVQDSGITGRGEKMQANLTLRVTAERLPEVLNELRQLGEVRSEKTTGEDVTTQVVDLEARLRNEQRVEAELLHLLEKRENSPLKEILELRRTIADVRQTIEQLTAQRERLSRLVSLATVLVIIRPAGAPLPEEPGLAAHFFDAMAGAWQKGTMFLVNTFAGLVGIIIGGLIWWILLIVVIVLVRNYLHRRAVTQA